MIEESQQEIRSVRMTIKAPAVIRLLSYVALKRKKQLIRFSRLNVFIRDQHTCQYCDRKFQKNHLTLDHVVPVVQGGGKSWDNIVTACKPCNQRKGGRTPTQANMQLVKKPKRPLWLPGLGLQLGASLTPESWRIYLRISDPSDDDPLADL